MDDKQQSGGQSAIGHALRGGACPQIREKEAGL